MRDRQQGKNERKLSKNKPTDSSKFRTAVRRELWVGKGRERKGREGMGGAWLARPLLMTFRRLCIVRSRTANTYNRSK